MAWGEVEREGEISRAGLSRAHKLPMAAMGLEHLCMEGISPQPPFST